MDISVLQIVSLVVVIGALVAFPHIVTHFGQKKEEEK
jgi:hypothetical protein